MDFLAILICLSIERLTNFGKVARDFHVLEHEVKFTQKILEKIKFPVFLEFIISISIAPLIIGTIYWLLSFYLFGTLSLIFAILILFYCLGTFDVSNDKNIGLALKDINDNIFAVFFWFVVFGEYGLIAAVVYRSIELTAKHANSAKLEQFSLFVKKYLDWFPVRLFSLAMAFVSHFVATMPYWLKHVFSSPNSNELMLNECGDIAIQADIKAIGLKKKIKQLTDRVLVFWLVVFALAILL